MMPRSAHTPHRPPTPSKCPFFRYALSHTPGRSQVRFGEEGAMFKLSQMFPDPSSAFLINCMTDSSGVKEACEKV